MKKAWQGKLFFLLSVLLLVGCKDKSSALVRTWKLQDLQYTRTISPQMQATVNKSIEDMKANVRLTYYADGTYKTILKGSELHGTWKLNWNSTKMTTMDDGGKPKEYSIIELTDNLYKFEAMEEKEKVIFVMIPAN
jgi:Lipocalin-like domain